MAGVVAAPCLNREDPARQSSEPWWFMEAFDTADLSEAKALLRICPDPAPMVSLAACSCSGPQAFDAITIVKPMQAF